MTFTEEIWTLLIDKVLLAGIAFFLWHYYSRAQRRLEVKEQKADALTEEIRRLKAEREATDLTEQIALLERRLTEFLWPIQYHLQKDGALWPLVPRLSKDSPLTEEAGNVIEREELLPNHHAALDVIARGFGLIGPDEELSVAVITYVRHLTVYKALRASGDGRNPIDVREPFPENLPALIEARLASTRNALEELRERRCRAQ